MRGVGEFALLTAFVSSGFAATVNLFAAHRAGRAMRIAANVAALIALLSLTAVMAILGWALCCRDFSFDYVAQYSSSLLPWHYSLSALWVGQAGSLLLWTWFVAVLALLFRRWPGRGTEGIRMPAFGILMGYQCFLAAIMVFAADPMAASISVPREGVGLSPLLQHPAMLIHPPVVFLGYSLWAFPFALAAAALLTGRLDTAWVRAARPWALLAWTVLGVGILLGANWAYEELGWGGYWAWDPVENGSLLPWLTGTALIHGLMAWQHRRLLKKTALALTFTTFGLCNFATFLTRSGVFSSLHAFSQSPIGWLFLAMMMVVGGSCVFLLLRHRRSLAADQPIPSIVSREACVVIGSVALLLLAAVVLAGTLSSALSSLIAGRAILVGPKFYNNVLIPTGLLLMLTTAAVPLLRWGAVPSPAQRRWLLICGCSGGVAAVAAMLLGVRQPIALAVIGLAVMASTAIVGGLVLDADGRCPGRPYWALLVTLQLQRRQYAGYLIHMGFICLALGITGSSLGKREQQFVMTEGQAVQWGNRRIRLASVRERELPDKLVAEAELEIVQGNGKVLKLVPAQHYHRLQKQWTTEVAIHASWRSDFYAILHSGNLQGQLYLTFVENPLMQWIWGGGAIMVLGAVIRLWPNRRRKRRGSRRQTPYPAEQKRYPATEQHGYPAAA